MTAGSRVVEVSSGAAVLEGAVVSGGSVGCASSGLLAHPAARNTAIAGAQRSKYRLFISVVIMAVLWLSWWSGRVLGLCCSRVSSWLLVSKALRAWFR